MRAVFRLTASSEGAEYIQGAQANTIEKNFILIRPRETEYTSLRLGYLGNESYRLQHSSLAAQAKIKSRERKRKDDQKPVDDEPF